MNSQQLLYVNIILGLFFAAYFILGRGKSRAPTKLNLKANEDFSKTIVPRESPAAAASSANVLNAKNYKQSQIQTSQPLPEEPKVTVLEPENVIDLNAAKANRPPKNLNIYFMYNGHEWESHEVLGVPAGAQMPVVTEAYQKLILTSDTSTYEFYESAYQAILKRWRDRL